MTEDTIIDMFLTGSAQSVRIETKLAKKWLLANKSVITGATLRFFQIRNLGLGVWEVALLPKGYRGTLMVKKFV